MSAASLPDALNDVVMQLSRLPGLGPKSALRCAMALLRWPEAQTRRLGQSILELRDKLHLCSRCGALADTDPCSICADPMRNAEMLCLVAEWDSMLTLEGGAFYQGLYFILDGLLSPLENITPETLDLARLERRLAEGEVHEVIFALGTRLEAETTAHYLKERIARLFPQIRVSRLAQGIPLGAEVRYMDRETLRQSLAFRQDL